LKVAFLTIFTSPTAKMKIFRRFLDCKMYLTNTFLFSFLNDINEFD